MSYSEYMSKEGALLDLLASDVEQQQQKQRQQRQKTIVRHAPSPSLNNHSSSRFSKPPRRGRSVAVVEGMDGIESQAVDDQSTVSKMTAPKESIELPYDKIQHLRQEPDKKGEDSNSRSRRRAKWIFWGCFVSQLITIGVLIGFLTSKGILFVQETSSASSTASASDDGETTVMIGINDTYQVDEFLDEFLEEEEPEDEELEGDEDVDDIPLCQYEDNTRVSVRVDKLCYTLGVDPIVVSFENCSPEPDDWIGIYDASHNIFEPGMYRVDYWSWACGNQECQEPSLGGQISFPDVLTLGSFRVHLHRREGTPTEMYLASSEEFVVAETCGGFST